MNYLIFLALAVVLGVLSVALIKAEEKRNFADAETADTTSDEEAADTASNGEAAEALPDSETAATLMPASNKKIIAFTAAAMLISAGAAAVQNMLYGETLTAAISELVMLALVWVCAWSDKRYYIIPNKVVIIGLIARALLLAAIALTKPEQIKYEFLSSVIAATALFAVSLLCRAVASGAIGFGDVKLLGMLGFFLGTDRAWSSMLVTMIIAFIFSLFLVITKKANRKTEIPFAPIIFAGMTIAFYITSF